jgi:(E)-4-hydroxy-3-methylbut-2-enyl-diphosphate synthase
MHDYRRKSRRINAGGLPIGGGAPVSVQSMTNTKTTDIKATVEQINRLAQAGCKLVRLAIPDRESVAAFAKIRERVDIPLAADIHFDYRLALGAVDAGADKIRINPGNIGSPDRIKAVADACRQKGVPIRVGVNSGSVQKEILARFGGATVDALVESAVENVKLLEKYDFNEICVSIKASDISRTIRANIAAAERFDYPLHIGITEAGRSRAGVLRSAIGIGALLALGIGDTIRVSLTGDPVEEVKAGYDILKAAGLAPNGINVISCPTCGRTRVNLEKIAADIETALERIKTRRPVTVAVMGCEVNGPGEAREADIGLAGGNGVFLLFVRGQPIGRVSEQEAIERLVSELLSLDL